MQTETLTKAISDNVSVEMKTDVYLGERLDTRIKVDGEWWVCGALRDEFCEKLGALIDEYRI